MVPWPEEALRLGLLVRDPSWLMALAQRLHEALQQGMRPQAVEVLSSLPHAGKLWLVVWEG